MNRLDFATKAYHPIYIRLDLVSNLWHEYGSMSHRASEQNVERLESQARVYAK